MINTILFFDLNQLVYVDSADQCNDLGFNIGGGASTITRAWTIKVFNLFYSSTYGIIVFPKNIAYLKIA